MSMINQLGAFEYENIAKAFLDLGLNFKRFFPEDAINIVNKIYKNYEWIVKSVPRFNKVINAVPPNEKMKELPWEEWFVLNSKIYHHVLYLKAPDQYDEIFNAPQIDDIHPVRTLGKIWYVIDDPDMSPVLLRRN
jgi:hypothetical protein